MSAADEAGLLGTEARRLAFPAAVLRLAALLGLSGEIGRPVDPAEERIRFRAEPSLAFPASEIAAIRIAEDNAPTRAEVEVTFLGLYGPSSPMPAAWTERIVTDADGSANLRDLLDLFDHPLIALAYRIWRHYRLELHFDGVAIDAGSRAALALAGIAPSGWDDPDLELVRLLPLCGLLGQYARSAAVLGAILSRYLRVPVAIEEWLPRRVQIPLDQQFRLGAPQVALGSGTVAGETVPDVVGAVTIVIGPLSASEFDDLLPGGAGRRALRALLRLALRDPIDCFVDLVLDDKAPAGLVLGGGRLGATTWQDGPGSVRRCPTGLA